MKGLPLRYLGIFELEGLLGVDSKPIDTKRLVRFGGHGKRGESMAIREEDRMGFNPLKEVSK